MQMRAKCCLTMQPGPAVPGMPGRSPASDVTSQHAVLLPRLFHCLLRRDQNRASVRGESANSKQTLAAHTSKQVNISAVDPTPVTHKGLSPDISMITDVRDRSPAYS